MKNQRNKMLRNNILFSGILKIIGLLTSLLIVPITIGYLNNEVYGIWMTITSILYWFTFFDVGLGNGMRNYLTQAISKGNYALGKAYLSTTLCVLTLIAIIIGIISVLPLCLLDFNKVFNSNTLSNTELRNIMIIALSFTLANFVLKNIGFVFIALQKYAINDLLSVSGSVVGLIITYILTKTTTGNLMYIVLALTISPVCIYLIAAFPIFKKYKDLKPSIHAFDAKLLKNIVGKGLGFFVIQITSCLVIYGSSNLFITQFCGPTAVTTYNIAYKYFNLLAIGYTVIISPMWNAYTDAYIKEDFQWIKKTFHKALLFWAFSVIAGIIMLAGSSLFYNLWVGEKVIVPFTISACVLVYISCFNLNNSVTYLINGLNKIKVQMITSIVFTAGYILILLALGNQAGSEGIILCMTLCYASMAVIHLYQCHLLIRNKAKGIWNQ